ncbi:hypothetical protein J2744_002637 [Halorubrum trapanicum]|jgi:hypothetical protein|uniref:Uncharacterized protein n=2 Tax=Halorubrum TaxID=56688 RepID=A0A2A2F6Q4_9EURY|nr:MULTISPECIES: hypothetical protein [Halorubrum]MBP1902935.1 hypothetical protein [Halorubrum trapanicum]PAU80272.1 hypothetical protein CK500_15515 [Halorubrum salipaludis]
MAMSSKTLNVGLRDVGFSLLCIVSVAAILPVQFVSLIVFDTIGLDQFIPSTVIYTVVPAVVVTAIPAIVAARQYNRRGSQVITAVVFIAAILASILVWSGFFVIG